MGSRLGRPAPHSLVGEHGEGVDVGRGLGLGGQRTHELHGRGVEGIGQEVVCRGGGGAVPLAER